MLIWSIRKIHSYRMHVIICILKNILDYSRICSELRSVEWSGLYLCGFASQFATQFEPNENQTSNCFAKRKHAIKKGSFTWIAPKETTDLTLYLNINDLRPFIRTTVTFKKIIIKMWYLVRAAVKNVRINLGQLRIKRQIDSQLCDSIFAPYVTQAWLWVWNC